MHSKGWRSPSMQSRGGARRQCEAGDGGARGTQQDAKQQELIDDADCGVAAQGKEGEA
jgi:hypothetical protein